MGDSILRLWDLWLILLLLATVVPWRGYQRVKKLLALEVITSADRVIIYASTILFQWLLAGAALWRARARNISLSQMGVATGSSVSMAGLVGIAAALSLVLLVIQARSMRALARLPAEKQGRMGLFLRKLMPPTTAGWAERGVFAGVALTAGVCEEFLFRGFAITALMILISWGNHASAAAGWASTFIASAIFAASHAYQGLPGIVSTFLVGLLFSLVFLTAGSLLPTVIAHTIVDLVGAIWAQHVLARGEGGTGNSRIPL